MSAELWLEAIGEIDGSYIEEVLAERQAEHRRRVRRAWLAAAACLVIVLSVAIPSVLRQRMENGDEEIAGIFIGDGGTGLFGVVELGVRRHPPVEDFTDVIGPFGED